MDRAEGLEADLPARPDPVQPGIDTRPMLYDSARHWIDQLTAYRAHKTANGNDRPRDGDSQ